jgi:hypothetical protein
VPMNGRRNGASSVCALPVSDASIGVTVMTALQRLYRSICCCARLR